MLDVATVRGYWRLFGARGMPGAAIGDHNGRVRLAVVDEIEEFVRAGALWDERHRAELISALERDGDAIAALLTHPLRSVGLRAEQGEIPKRLASDLEGIVYPRLWKIMEAVRDEMPDGELRVRIEVFHRRLARR